MLIEKRRPYSKSILTRGHEIRSVGRSERSASCQDANCLQQCGFTRTILTPEVVDALSQLKAHRRKIPEILDFDIEESHVSGEASYPEHSTGHTGHSAYRKRGSEPHWHDDVERLIVPNAFYQCATVRICDAHADFVHLEHAQHVL